jgi:hypothetical protein
MIQHHSQRGFTMFFAVLVSALTLAIGAAILDLVLRELAISQTTEESQFAIFMADTGAECALYWDSQCTLANCPNKSIFATSTDSTGGGNGHRLIPLKGSAPTVLCRSELITNSWSFQLSANAATTTFWFGYTGTLAGSGTTGAGVTQPRCAQVEVGKYMDGPTPRTLINSHGFSDCTSAVPSATDPRPIYGAPQLVERELQVRY